MIKMTDLQHCNQQMYLVATQDENAEGYVIHQCGKCSAIRIYEPAADEVFWP